ncbi:MAG: hypothetical protein KKF67_02965 [Nanoarchaeota archaeon]|nr:hypothetical protein [Nanoarchaeota archaeon]
MKKIIFLFLIFLFLFPIISAVEFTIKDEFKQGETLLAKVSGNFVDPILKENINFYRGHVRVSIEPFVAKINDEFYIYALLPETANNYSIVISGAKYMNGSQLSDANITKEFVITNLTADFSVSPGFAVAENDFSLEVQNLQDSQITIEITSETISGDEEDFSFNDSVSLKSGEIKKIKFNLDKITEPTFKIVKLTSKGSDSGDSSFWGLGSSSGSGDFSYEIPVNIFDIDKKAKTHSTGDDDVIDLDNITNQSNEEDGGEEYVPTTTSTCAELGGKICSSGEECSGTVENARDAPCCLAECSQKTTSSVGKIIGWILAIAAIVFVLWFLKYKYRGAKREINLFDIGKK